MVRNFLCILAAEIYICNLQNWFVLADYVFLIIKCTEFHWSGQQFVQCIANTSQPGRVHVAMYVVFPIL